MSGRLRCPPDIDGCSSPAPLPNNVIHITNCRWFSVRIGYSGLVSYWKCIWMPILRSPTSITHIRILRPSAAIHPPQSMPMLPWHRPLWLWYRNQTTIDPNPWTNDQWRRCQRALYNYYLWMASKSLLLLSSPSSSLRRASSGLSWRWDITSLL